MVEPGESFEDFHDDEPSRPLLPPDDRLWRHPSELSSSDVLSTDQVLAARRSWLANTPSRAGAGTAGLVGALLATGLVLVGTHFSGWLSSQGDNGSVHQAVTTGFDRTASTTPPVEAPGLAGVFASVDAALVQVRAYSEDGSREADGVIISSNGYVLAPAAFVRGAMSVSVIRSDGEELVASVLGTDDATGLAVLHVDESRLPWIELSTSRQELPDSFALLAWRNPSFQLKLARMSTAPGVTSISDGPALLEVCPSSLHLSRSPDGAIIIDSEGQISGIVSSHRGGKAIATPGWLAERVAGDLIADGQVIHGWLGIEGATTEVAAEAPASNGAMTEDMAHSDKAPAGATGGVRVLAVEPGSAAAKAGLRRGDIIEAVDGRSVPTMADLQAVLYLMTPSTSVSLDVVRDSQSAEMDARLQAAA